MLGASHASPTCMLASSEAPEESFMAIKTPGLWFPSFAKWTAAAAGKPAAFAIGVLIVVVLGKHGSSLSTQRYLATRDNTGTTIVTFLMVFLIQNTQNRDTQALQLKLDELIRVTKGARNLLLDLEHLDDEHLDRLQKVYEKASR